MDIGTVYTLATGIAGATGGYFGGRVFGNNHSVETAANVVDMMKTEVEILKSRLDGKDEEVTKLTTELSVVKELVTQRANVEAVHEDVKEIKVTVDKIAEKVGA